MMRVQHLELCTLILPLLHEIKRGCTKANTTWFHYYDNNKDLCLHFQGQPENHLYDEYGSFVKYYLNLQKSLVIHGETQRKSVP